ncbi:hypothetical protein NJD71_09800 [Psychrobacter sp. PP-21]|uniref:hypothetical protein n=1 Tax=Psychrobacter sp. PP-21 TaxID=2957503 RepID=UPI0029B45051|nr:hypothetical protein [Psychrobacter sp. PP-21]MDX2374416.1 hypothetical protein [Psychrobacter sp. PP-21]
MNRVVAISGVLSVAALTVVGCGEEDGASYGSGSSTITLTSFDSSYDSKANDTAIARIDETYRTGARDIKTTNLINSYSNQSLNDLDRTVLADNFEGRLENKDIKVSNRTVKRPIYEKNSNNKLGYETTYQTLNLSGLNANSYSAGTNIEDRRGIRTALSNYSNIPTNIAFPEGSVCYIPVVTSERSFLAFNDKNKTGYSSLEKWLDAAKQRFSDDRDHRTSQFGVGIENKQAAAQVMFFAYNNQPAYEYSGVEYGKDIYEANYVAKGSINPNTDSRFGVVDCTLVNEVAGDFLAEQIKRYY